MSGSKIPHIPPPTVPDDFAKFDRAMGDALASIVTDPPSGPVPPVKSIPTEVPVVTPTVVPNTSSSSIEDANLEAYRAMLRAEEKRLEGLVKPPPLTTGPVGGYVPSQFGSPQSELVVREGADPLHIESFKILRRLVASGSPLLTLVDYGSLTRHMQQLRESIEPKSTKPVASV